MEAPLVPAPLLTCALACAHAHAGCAQWKRRHSRPPWQRRVRLSERPRMPETQGTPYKQWVPKINLIKPRSAGAHLDPRRVLDALDPEMPLALAADTLAAMMRTALHRRRAGALSRSLHRACHLSAAAERAEVCAGHRLSPTEERGVARLPPARLCRACHLLRACSQRCSPSWDQLGQGQVLTLELSACATRPEGAR